MARQARTPRLPPEIRRRQILDATLEVIDERSFGGVTLDAVAKRAGITRPVVYDQFGDLDGLLEAFIEDAESKALTAVGGALPDPDLGSQPNEMLADALRAFLEGVRSDPRVWRIILLPPEGTPGSVRGRIERRRGELAEGIGEIIEIVAERRGILPGVVPVVLARGVIAAAEEMGRLVLERPSSFNPTKISRATRSIVALIPGASEGGER